MDEGSRGEHLGRGKARGSWGTKGDSSVMELGSNSKEKVEENNCPTHPQDAVPCVAVAGLSCENTDA